ncbi:MAG: LuxR C-terminal-related transcriptional regulator [Sulfitobacter pontiacus]|uniref:helix-turn-helix transcriptional regulator n=1 Tax=Sulfitobacter pontiacus TaxID=60137 RepID=UPI0032631E06
MIEALFHSSAADIENALDLEQIWELFSKGIAKAEIEFATYITVNADFEAPMVLTTTAGIYAGVPPSQDPFLRWCCASYHPTRTGAEFLADYDYLPTEAKAFIAHAGTLGFRSGLGLPVRLQGSDRFGGFNLGTRLSRNAFETKIAPLSEQLQFFCLLTHRRIEELSRDLSKGFANCEFRALLIAPITEAGAQLSPREREVVYLVARGISRKECALLCNISPNTVAEYTKNAYRKLNVKNRFEAAEALRVV